MWHNFLRDVAVSRYGSAYCIVLAELFIRLHDVDHPLMVVVKHADLHCIEEVGLRAATYDTRNKLKHFESSVTMMRHEFAMGYVGVGITTHSI
jgi:hypothetical protein